MTTSLPPEVALYHAQAKVFQRSAGRSAIAAAAYRSGSKLYDQRTGQMFNYKKKPVVDAFILVPAQAPEWTRAREILWNRAEKAELRSNAVVAREWEISIPRDIPKSEWTSVAQRLVEPWVQAGAVADVAIHCPKDIYGDDQPHFHIMLTTRALDSSTDSGFSKRKNDALTRLFESGGRNGGGKVADALKSERERISDVMNLFLRAAGSERRTSHLSNVARYPECDRAPEPTMGRGRLLAAHRRRRGDRRTKSVSATRALRKIENTLTRIEENLMNLSPKQQAGDCVRTEHQQVYKKKLFARRFPKADSAEVGRHLHMVDVRSPTISVLQACDGGWLELEDRIIQVYGTRGYADTLAQQLLSADYANEIRRVDGSARVKKRSRTSRPLVSQTDKGHLSARPYKRSDTLRETSADRWRSRGFTEILEAAGCIYVRIGNCQIQDLGSELRIYGAPSGPLVKAIIAKVIDDWGAEFEAYGTRSFKDAAWLEAQRQGAHMFDGATGEPYRPSAEICAMWEVERGTTQKHQIAEIGQTQKLMEIMRSAARGDQLALNTLRALNPHLAHFLTRHLDEAQLAELVYESDESLEPQLDGMSEIGASYADRVAARGENSSELASEADVGDIAKKALKTPAIGLAHHNEIPSGLRLR